MQAPHLANALKHAFPSDGANAMLLGADGTEVAHVVVTAIVAAMRSLAVATIFKGSDLPPLEVLIYCLDIHLIFNA